MPIDLTAVLSALIAGLSLLGTPAAIASSQLHHRSYPRDRISGSLGLAESLRPTESVAVSSYPHLLYSHTAILTSLRSEIIQIGTLSSTLKNANQNLSQRLSSALWTIMSDQHSFNAFASSGTFTGDPKFSVPQAVAGLSDGLTLYVLTKALVGNKYQATYTPTDVIERSALNDLCSHNSNGCATATTRCSGAWWRG